MAVPNESPSQSRQHLEAHNAYDDESRQAEDDDWPTLISSIENDVQAPPQDHVDSMVQVEADEAMLNSIVSRGSGQSSRHTSQQAFQQAPLKMLTRPVSSGKDPAAGFSFTKAKPIQQFDFRRSKQAPVTPQSPDLPRPSENIPTEAYRDQSLLLSNTNQASQSVVDPAVPHGSPPKHHNPSASRDALPMSLSDATPAQSQAYKNPARNTAKGPVMLNFSSAHTLPNECPTATDDTMTQPYVSEIKEPPMLNIIIPDHSRTTTTAPVRTHSPIEIARVVDQGLLNKPNRSCMVSKDPLTSVTGAPKITKSRLKNQKTDPAADGPPRLSNTKEAYTEDDLLKLLMYRRRQGQQELEYFRATQSQKVAEIQRLREISDNLSHELQEVSQRETQKTAELSRIKANKPIWESKIKRLSDYVKGLTNDHKRLREDADDLQKQRSDVFIAGKELHNALEGAQISAEQDRIRSQKCQDGARHEIESLAQTVQQQCTQLQNDKSLLQLERERSNRLEDRIARITVSHDQMLQAFTGHRDGINDKLDALLHQAKSIVLPNKAPEPPYLDPIRPMLEQCVSMLQKLHEVDAVKPEDLGKLGDTMDSFVRGIALSVESCEENCTSIAAGQQKLALALQDQFGALSGTISSEHALSEQINDLREVRAIVRERLQATESSLADARREVVALRHKDQEQSQQVVYLEAEVVRARIKPAENPQPLLRIQELEFRNKDLQSEITILREKAAGLSSQIQQSSIESEGMAERLAHAQERLKAAHEETARTVEDKSACERRAALDRENLRKDLSNAANMQLTGMQSEHMNALQQLKLEKSPIEEKLNDAMNQVKILRGEKEKVEKETSKLQAMLKDAQNEKEAIVGTRKALQLHLKEMEVRMHETNIQSRDLQAMLNKTYEQLRAKDLEIMALKASQVTRESSSRAAEHNNTSRGAETTGNGHAPHPEFQQPSIGYSPSTRPANSKSSRPVTNRPPVVEDSQPGEKPNFVSLNDLIPENPFADYAQEGPQIIAGEDISHLFPSTPGTGSYARELDYSRKSMFHTTVVSETQRRQHQSFREATPHTSTHSIVKPRDSQSQSRAYSKDGQIHAMPRASVATSSINIDSSRRDPIDPSSLRGASITRELIQSQGSVNNPRQGKRNTLAAGFNDTNSQARPSKMHKAGPVKVAKTLGPVVEDSQSPLLNGRSRKLTKKKSSTRKVDKFARRFAQE